MRSHIRALAILASVTLAAGCSEPTTTPTATGSSQQSGETAATSKYQDAGATASWNALATSLADRVAIDQGRMYAYLSMAQFRAAMAANDPDREQHYSPGGFHRRYPDRLSVSAAIGGASAAVLRSFFPANVDEINAALAAQQASPPETGRGHNSDDFEDAAAMGADVAAEVLAYAASDGVGLTDPGTPPIGDGYWKWSGGPIVRGNYRARAFFLASDDEFRPGPPPAFGSAEYLAALGEVRQISDTRTAEQLAIAQYWNLQQSGRRNAPWNNKAVELIRRYHVSDAQAARIMFMMSAAVYDALVGCFDAKYEYWFIRPPQADPLITLPIGLPPHPSYPSAHSCVSGSSSGVLKALFPQEAASLDAMSQEASLSRLYGGIHYRFDMVAGLALGNAVADKVVHSDLNHPNGL
ncbi:MAG: phosphoesterase PA-phosphatase related protein [Gemmatimonadetes bacterium]|nr:phosphoesterase PA-phosphatase related protein [Gemmatimonadota bacterium]